MLVLMRFPCVCSAPGMGFGGFGRLARDGPARRLLFPLFLLLPATSMRQTFSPQALGSMRQAMIERDLAHIEHVLLHSHASARDNSALPLSYWHDRLRRIKDGGQLWGVHLRKIDSLQRVLDAELSPG
ncbi:hypothetical protein LMG22037_01078 [Paraburkholderia phenoliruptrix]|uniref:Uncharacterized protein n=2 Tax=Paraburkholderia phenoliruptrix TaxID=252970 RepID=A0A6J5A455_9BURK|nr:hypothetical protein LMG22037_01078 [Paraburkholderia phenoliruptrix]